MRLLPKSMQEVNRQPVWQSVWQRPARHGQAAPASALDRQSQWPFIGLWLFTLLLYLRPNETHPELFGPFQLTKLAAILTLVVYLSTKLSRGEQLTIWPPELKFVVLIWLLGAASMVFAAAPQTSFEMLTDVYLKVICIFALLINVIETKERLWSLLKLVVILSSGIALGAAKSYMAGELLAGGQRIVGPVSGILGNANDLATALDLLLPVALVFGLKQRGAARAFYFVCAAALVMGIVVTFSRAGFLGLLAVSGVLVWKLGRGRRATTLFGAVVLAGVFVLAMPSGYNQRLVSIVAIEEDKTGSAAEREELLKRAFSVAAHHPVLGVGMGNFPIYSIKEKVAHNAYLEIAAELGLGGLLVYLLLIIRPLRSLIRIERETQPANSAASNRNLNRSARDQAPVAELATRDLYLLSVALQASFAAYIVCSFFSSVQYQWYLYYLVAYAISLRRIHAATPDAEPRAVEARPMRRTAYQVHTRFKLLPPLPSAQIPRTSTHGD